MKCVICKSGSVKRGKKTLSFDESGTIVVVKAVPCRVCSQCGEAYLNEHTMERVEAMLDAAKSGGAEVTVRDYAAA